MIQQLEIHYIGVPTYLARLNLFSSALCTVLFTNYAYDAALTFDEVPHLLQARSVALNAI